ncbi:hypothetical protein SAICODRAFT_155025 [Saitoella complicata NRRL Y-17804]|uniref:uncharacterized protein n=1 Tax=Saitoella complicata (strain BCRC 22490 / CBS 7301 / JCM 7358 / NBRC 10748 / NRRL Y-17804) TaxID=698492 RepID=UPI000867985A|nr:uncharacterized protein SAICODRAFT_155025 [Saitoella complicata NRRL Y-17804]ODQ51351.1 hypothetical protein SAICODRAFT_155025 [Saitoella complicata NRRL Y-17804]
MKLAIAAAALAAFLPALGASPTEFRRDLPTNSKSLSLSLHKHAPPRTRMLRTVQRNMRYTTLWRSTKINLTRKVSNPHRVTGRPGVHRYPSTEVHMLVSTHSAHTWVEAPTPELCDTGACSYPGVYNNYSSSSYGEIQHKQLWMN